MDALTTAAAAGMRARMESLDLLANNISNAGTTGYKADRESYGRYISAEAATAEQQPEPTALPIVETQWTDFSQGALITTDKSLDFAVTGSGLFTVKSPRGILYTRSGSFQLSPAGELQTSEGYAVQSTKMQPIVLKHGGVIQAGPDGVLRQDGQQVGELAIASYPGGKMSKAGGGYFLWNDPQTQPAAAAGSSVLQGKLESANVGAPETAVRLVTVMRQFEMLQRALTIGADMNRRSVEEIAKTGT